jgi:hypothetical protein
MEYESVITFPSYEYEECLELGCTAFIHGA